MKTFTKKRIEVIIEAPALRKVLKVFESHKVLGYTIFSVLAGSGHEGRWDAAGLVGESGRMVSIMCVLDAAELDLVLEYLEPVVLTQIGIVMVSDVQVIRPHHF